MFGSLLFAYVPFATISGDDIGVLSWNDECVAQSMWADSTENSDTWSDDSLQASEWTDSPLSIIPNRRCT